VCTAVVGPGVPVLPLLQVSGAAYQAHPLQGGQGQSQAGRFGNRVSINIFISYFAVFGSVNFFGGHLKKYVDK
jgi:hypothetical protein